MHELEFDNADCQSFFLVAELFLDVKVILFRVLPKIYFMSKNLFDNNSKIEITGPTKISRFGIPLLAENYSLIDINS